MKLLKKIDFIIRLINDIVGWPFFFLWEHRFKVLISIVLLYCIFQFLFIPYIQQVVYESSLIGYNTAINELASQKAVPLVVDQGGEQGITLIDVCSDVFVQQYQNICGAGR